MSTMTVSDLEKIVRGFVSVAAFDAGVKALVETLPKNRRPDEGKAREAFGAALNAMATSHINHRRRPRKLGRAQAYVLLTIRTAGKGVWYPGAKYDGNEVFRYGRTMQTHMNVIDSLTVLGYLEKKRVSYKPPNNIRISNATGAPMRYEWHVTKQTDELTDENISEHWGLYR